MRNKLLGLMIGLTALGLAACNENSQALAEITAPKDGVLPSEEKTASQDFPSDQKTEQEMIVAISGGNLKQKFNDQETVTGKTNISKENYQKHFNQERAKALLMLAKAGPSLSMKHLGFAFHCASIEQGLEQLKAIKPTPDAGDIKISVTQFKCEDSADFEAQVQIQIDFINAVDDSVKSQLNGSLVVNINSKQGLVGVQSYSKDFTVGGKNIGLHAHTQLLMDGGTVETKWGGVGTYEKDSCKISSDGTACDFDVLEEAI